MLTRVLGIISGFTGLAAAVVTARWTFDRFVDPIGQGVEPLGRRVLTGLAGGLAGGVAFVLVGTACAAILGAALVALGRWSWSDVMKFCRTLRLDP